MRRYYRVQRLARQSAAAREDSGALGPVGLHRRLDRSTIVELMIVDAVPKKCKPRTLATVDVPAVCNK